ncbi:MAG TPA: sugar phosphate isomerase/epimerase, partial [Chloroflexota bacterium]
PRRLIHDGIISARVKLGTSEAFTMKLGFLTACLPDRSLEQVAAWASSHSYGALEVAAWPTVGGRSHTAAHVNVENLTATVAQSVGELFQKYDLTLSSLAFYENNLHPDPRTRSHLHDHLRRCLDAAALLQCPTVGTFIGRDPERSVEQNRADAEKVFAPFIDRAKSLGVTIVIENCPMPGWHPDGYPGNIAYSPQLWDWMISLGLELNFDPSHLAWLGIDPIEAARAYIGHIHHIQAKDVEISLAGRNTYGIYGTALDRQDPWDSGWWQYRIPGLGEINWNKLIDTLYAGGYDGVISVEHEDPIWSGTAERIEDGLILAQRELSRYILR